ncbi:MAG TPA: FumA C-terminus/TtdB family hydratase beta subunit [Candidatus Hydrothermia bacterium]|jgi:fumarate hydratase subunit beta|nr:fumarate hydratase C-terminal domain-containing protein [Candidatus Hydrothermae bacterium]MDD3648976.1 FumA C-terminus/TtdB family hydratase beta subunit [Candidatus Hydrothermia bacterium]MDD5573109.1 FumA C-terminus/TtdB family hydratase beta subunit [Candidatus Hydrothermia bacterium]HOK23217.1 FumA C-terminus/TtdB family hydratase beta subunit [Candidatus Hydrothermia bacterium]HOL23921.1 FumA C-terminus/TtdB family hydratase beta subunit [Candidatus Hydrothermia bacterium]
MAHYDLRVPFVEKGIVEALKAGDKISLTGTIYTARDAAHKRIKQELEEGSFHYFPLTGAVIYYCGPTPAPPGRVIGSAGPTTSYRMDPYVSLLVQHGVKGFIGKGKRSQEVKEVLKTHGGVYLIATGGAGALLSTRILSAKVIAYPDLGPEAIFEFYVKDFPVIVGIDTHGNDIYEIGPSMWLNTLQKNPLNPSER